MRNALQVSLGQENQFPLGMRLKRRDGNEIYSRLISTYAPY